jgi:hypothetical protein
LEVAGDEQLAKIERDVQPIEMNTRQANSRRDY